MKLFRAVAALALGLSLSMGSAVAQEACPGGFSEQFRLRGQVQTPKRFRFADLQNRVSSRVSISFFAGGSGFNTRSYTGVPLIDLLNEAVVVTDPTRHNDILRKYVVVRATDCYEAVIAVADLLPNFGHQQVLIAYADGNGESLGADEGMARLIIVNDKQGGRLISNVNEIVVRSAPGGPLAE